MRERRTDEKKEGEEKAERRRAEGIGKERKRVGRTKRNRERRKGEGGGKRGKKGEKDNERLGLCGRTQASLAGGQTTCRLEIPMSTSVTFPGLDGPRER